MLGKIKGKTRKGRQRLGWIESISGAANINLKGRQKAVMDKRICRAEVHEVTEGWIRINDCTAATSQPDYFCK